MYVCIINALPSILYSDIYKKGIQRLVRSYEKYPSVNNLFFV